MANLLITAEELASLSGVDVNYFTDELIAYGQAHTKALLGYLDEETKSYSILILANAPRKIIPLTEKNCTVTKLEYRTSSSSEWGEITTYRVIEGIILLDSFPGESDYEYKITCKVGWLALPTLVKYLLVLVILQLLDTVQPNTVDFNVVYKKLGDFTVRYQDKFGQSIQSVINFLVELIKHGGLASGVSI